MEQKLIFVYNADSSLEHQVFDFLHKAISPSTYQCSLCSVTYGTFRMRDEWRAFISGLSLPVEFFYRNEFRRYHSNFKTEYPVVLLQGMQKLEVLLTAAELKDLNLEGLMMVLSKRVDIQLAKST